MVQVLPSTERSLPPKAIGARRLLKNAEGLGRVSIARPLCHKPKSTVYENIGTREV